MDSAKDIARERVISLETYKKNGEAVRSPVWLVEEAGVIYVRTDPQSWKAKRIRRNPRVRVAPSDMRGNVKGPWADGEAHFVEGDVAGQAIRLIKEKYGMLGGLIDGFNSLRGRHQVAVIAIKLA
jgi:uncharacterized protein